MNYVRRGCGPPLLLIHPIGATSQIFVPVFDRLAEHHDVIAVDLPGFGASPAGTDQSPAGLAAAVTALTSDLGIDRPAVAGWSLGGAVALELGRSGAANAVSAFAPVGFWSRVGRWYFTLLVTALRGLGRFARPAVAAVLRTRPGRLALLSLLYGHPSQVDGRDAMRLLDDAVAARGFAETVRQLARYDLRHLWDEPGRLASIPVTVAWGRRDAVLPARTQARRAAAALPGVPIHLLAGSGHFSMHDDPERCIDLILAGRTNS